MQIDIKDTNNAVKGSMGLSELVFANEASEALVHEAVVAYLANQRQGTHMTKTRGLVSGGGRKPYKQKSTGRARAGSSRSPHLEKRRHDLLDRSARLFHLHAEAGPPYGALQALTMKLNDGQIVVLESLAVSKPNTKEIVKVVANLGLSDKNIIWLSLTRPEHSAVVPQSAECGCDPGS